MLFAEHSTGYKVPLLPPGSHLKLANDADPVKDIQLFTL